jgi:hypothetical protein
MNDFFSDILNHWRNDWNNRRSLFWMELFATLFAVSSALTLSIGLSSKESLLVVFLSYVVSNLLMAITCYIRGSSWIMIMVSCFFLINIIGIVNLSLHW